MSLVLSLINYNSLINHKMNLITHRTNPNNIGQLMLLTTTVKSQLTLILFTQILLTFTQTISKFDTANKQNSS